MLSIQKGLLKRLLIRYGCAVSGVAAAFLLRQVLTAYGASGLPTYITFYPAVMLVAIMAGFWPGFVATAIAGLGVDYWILPPHGFGVHSFTDAVGLILFSGMGVFMSLVAEFYRRARQQAQENSLELKRANEALRDLSSRLLSAHEEERKRVAAEIHDTIGACMGAIKFKVEGVVHQIDEKDPGVLSESLKVVLPVIQEGIEECRRIQMDLRPSLLDDLGLLPTLSWFCRRFQTIYSAIQIKQEIGIEEVEIPNALKIVIYRVTQEAMNNIAKHSKANRVRLSLQKSDDRMELILQDNGRGFDPAKVLRSESARQGLGLTNMRERVELSGGSLDIKSVEGKGTVIRASWPI